MIEIVQTEVLTVPVNQEIAFNTIAAKGGCAEYFRNGASVVRLLKPGRYLVTFAGNVAVPTGEAVGEVTLAIQADGGTLVGSTMRDTPAAVEEYFNVSTQHYVDVPICCGMIGTVSVSVANVGDIPVLFDNANLTIVRVA